MIFLGTILISVLLTNPTKADDMKLVGYEVVSDCNLPSKKVDCRIDEHGQEHCVIKLNKQCQEGDKT